MAAADEPKCARRRKNGNVITVTPPEGYGNAWPANTKVTVDRVKLG